MVSERLDELIDAEYIHLMAHTKAEWQKLEQVAFHYATFYDYLSFYDALLVALADEKSYPLLVADEDLYHHLRILSDRRGTFRVEFIRQLPDYWDRWAQS